MADCFCFRNYICLACERQANGPVRVIRTTPNRAVAACGTRAGYNRHLKQGEPTCQPCKDAQKEAVVKWKREKLERESA